MPTRDRQHQADAPGHGLEQQPSGTMSEEEIDYNVMGTFPASDPPSWTLGIRSRKKQMTEFEGEKISAAEPSHQNERVASDSSAAIIEGK